MSTEFQVYIDRQELAAAQKNQRLEIGLGIPGMAPTQWRLVEEGEFLRMIPTMESYLLTVCPVTGRDAIKIPAATYDPATRIVVWLGSPTLRIKSEESVSPRRRARSSRKPPDLDQKPSVVKVRP